MVALMYNGIVAVLEVPVGEKNCIAKFNLFERLFSVYFFFFFYIKTEL